MKIFLAFCRAAWYTGGKRLEVSNMRSFSFVRFSGYGYFGHGFAVVRA